MKIKGIITPIVTPMLKNEEVNYEEFKRQINRLINNGVHGIFIFGTNGEGYILTNEEKVKLMEVAVKEVNDRVPVYAMTGLTGTKETIRLTKKAEEIGVDAVSIVTPYFAAASQKEIYHHYKSIAENVNIPIILYNIPARSGNYISSQTVYELSKIPNIVGVKDSSGNFDNILQYIEITKNNKNFHVISGNDSLILWTLLAGGVGGIAGCSNVYPQTLANIYEYFINGEIVKAKECQDSIRSFRNCFKYGNPNTVVKQTVNLLGYDVGNCRAPFNYLPTEGIRAIKDVLKENNKKKMK